MLCLPDEQRPRPLTMITSEEKNRDYHAGMKFDYDHIHRVLERVELSPGDCVLIPDMKVEGTGIKQHDFLRSMVIQNCM